MKRRRKSGDSSTGSAGRRGERVRSDIWVEVEPKAKGGIQLELASRVEPYYGDSIRRQVAAGMSTLGVDNARVAIEDAGALPFVIAARLEAAVRAAGHQPAAPLLPERTVEPAPSDRDRLRRSRLYLPGNEPKFFINAGLHGPDAVILDLEDSVAPDAKTDARLLVRNALRTVDFHGAERMVRINQLPLGFDDLAEIVPQHPELILIPKVERPDQVREVDAIIAEALGGSERPLWLMPILESALGIEHAFDIARASDRVAALTIGLEDYSADIGVPRSADGIESMYARRRTINAAKAARVQAIDSVYSDVDNVEGLESWCLASKQIGFEGMGCLHPRQIEVIHAAYKPTEPEIEKALRIVAAFERAEAEGLAVVSLGSKMIDPPVVKQAQRLVAQARELGVISEDESATEAEK
ncbi:MAG: citrate lyase ACP [Acidobacteria bacterium]|nr:MAG: citrate lyase ACP [Acidobacteriota bacterium]